MHFPFIQLKFYSLVMFARWKKIYMIHYLLEEKYIHYTNILYLRHAKYKVGSRWTNDQTANSMA